MHDSGEFRTAMVLAAGLGTRLRPITDRLPKPLVPIGGATLLDRGLDLLAAAGVETAVVNVHHLPDLIIAHLAGRSRPRIIISDERESLQDSAGGIIAALPQLGPAPFFILNADTFWIDRGGSNIARLVRYWDPAGMDMLLLLVDPANAVGHGSGGGDFLLGEDGSLRRGKGQAGALIYTGFAIVHPRIFADAAPHPHSLNLYFDRAIADRRLYGLPLNGRWITVGTPDAIDDAENAVARTADAGPCAGFPFRRRSACPGRRDDLRANPPRRAGPARHFRGPGGAARGTAAQHQAAGGHRRRCRVL
jgi:MurNAc alpha-1-phosphate uridylyltransferase